MITLWGVSSKVECVNRCWHLAVDVDFNQPLKEFSYKSIVSQLHDFPKIDILHFLGGGYINDVFSRNVHLIPIASIIKQLTDCKLYATGVSFHPFKEINMVADRYFLRCLSSFDLIDVRDDYSIDLFKNYPVEIVKTCDDLFLPKNIDSLVSVENIDDKPYLNLMVSFDKVASMVYSYISEMIDYLIDNNIVFGVNFYCFSDYSEIEMRKLVSTKTGLRYKIYNCFDLLIRPIKLDAKGFYFCTKFHGHFLVSLAGMQGVCSAVNLYYDNKHKSLVDLGSGFKMIGMHDNIVSDRLFDFNNLTTFRDRHADLHKLKIDIAFQIYQ